MVGHLVPISENSFILMLDGRKILFNVVLSHSENNIKL